MAVSDFLIPDIDEGIELPLNAAEALPPLSPREEIEMRSRTAKLLAELSNTPLVFTEETKQQAQHVARQVNADPHYQPDYTQYPNEVIAYLAEAVREASFQLVENLSDLKIYVVNKLIFEVEHAKTSKDRISALAKLGEVDGVDAFKKRSETTVTVRPIEEVEKELLTVLDSIDVTFTMDEITYEETNDDSDDISSDGDDELYEGDLTDDAGAGSVGMDEPATAS